MTIFRQLAIAFESLALMGAVAATGAPGVLILVVALVGGTAVSRYDDGANR